MSIKENLYCRIWYVWYRVGGLVQNRQVRALRISSRRKVTDVCREAMEYSSIVGAGWEDGGHSS